MILSDFRSRQTLSEVVIAISISYTEYDNYFKSNYKTNMHELSVYNLYVLEDIIKRK